MGSASRKRVGTIGAGRIGQAMARAALRAGRSVVIANSRGPESLTSVVSALGDGAQAGTVPPTSSSSRCPGRAFSRPSRASNGTARS
jgi:NAD(P)-dependent dehydrogenase (short-subunit alcohol dehydrogenase family)